MTSQPLQAAIYTALDGVISCPVYDSVPANAAMPYVVIDSQQAIEDDGLTAVRERVTVYLSVWSRHRGQKEALGILAEIKAALHNSRPALSSGRCVSLRVMRTYTERDIAAAGTFTGYATVEARIAP